eukprot:g829.t1
MDENYLVNLVRRERRREEEERKNSKEKTRLILEDAVTFASKNATRIRGRKALRRCATAWLNFELRHLDTPREEIISTLKCSSKVRREDFVGLFNDLSSKGAADKIFSAFANSEEDDALIEAIRGHSAVVEMRHENEATDTREDAKRESTRDSLSGSHEVDGKTNLVSDSKTEAERRNLPLEPIDMTRKTSTKPVVLNVSGEEHSNNMNDGDDNGVHMADDHDDRGSGRNDAQGADTSRPELCSYPDEMEREGSSDPLPSRRRVNSLATSSEFLNALRLDLASHRVRDSLDRETRLRAFSSSKSRWNPPTNAANVADLFEVRRVLDGDADDADSNDDDTEEDINQRTSSPKKWSFVPLEETIALQEKDGSVVYATDEEMGRSMVREYQESLADSVKNVQRDLLRSTLRGLPSSLLKEFGHLTDELEAEEKARANEEASKAAALREKMAQERIQSLSSANVSPEQSQQKKKKMKRKKKKKAKTTKTKTGGRRKKILHSTGRERRASTHFGAKGRGTHHVEVANTEQRKTVRPADKEEDDELNALCQHEKERAWRSKTYVFPKTIATKHIVGGALLQGLQAASHMQPGYLSGSDLSPRARAYKSWERCQMLSRARELREKQAREARRRDDERLAQRRRAMSTLGEADYRRRESLHTRKVSTRVVKKISSIIANMQSSSLDEAAREAKPIVDLEMYKTRQKIANTAMGSALEEFIS